jgi:hypothetical protein
MANTANLLAADQLAQFERDSFLIIEDFLDAEETELLQLNIHRA